MIFVNDSYDFSLAGDWNWNQNSEHLLFNNRCENTRNYVKYHHLFSDIFSRWFVFFFSLSTFFYIYFLCLTNDNNLSVPNCSSSTNDNAYIKLLSRLLLSTGLLDLKLSLFGTKFPKCIYLTRFTRTISFPKLTSKFKQFFTIELLKFSLK